MIAETKPPPAGQPPGQLSSQAAEGPGPTIVTQSNILYIYISYLSYISYISSFLFLHGRLFWRSLTCRRQDSKPEHSGFLQGRLLLRSLTRRRQACTPRHGVFGYVLQTYLLRCKMENLTPVYGFWRSISRYKVDMLIYIYIYIYTNIYIYIYIHI